MREESKEYDVDKFIKGKQTLNPIEVNELGSVKGRGLLHLRCMGEIPLQFTLLATKI
jgi:hypothetical protein